jgi:hypothetical protein
MNRLKNETSPYLLQHANNPVDWYPWGDEALARARAEDKPILLSIGYSSCHWCHVMAHESFEDPETAALMNEHFINIKVDREERPDLDSIYMQAVQAMTGHGGWPMTVFLTPDGVPFYGGTYFPPEDRHGLPAFRRVLVGVADAYRTRREEVTQGGQRLLAALQQTLADGTVPVEMEPALLDQAYHQIASGFDRTFGGFGTAPKFPQPMNLEFLLRMSRRSGYSPALEMVEKTLRKMANGGIYDQLGGGFHRYSTDERWLVPHFEKMLYDNAQLARVYLHAYQITRQPFYRRIVEETLEYVLREMTSPEGGFYSTQDADSEGEEGKFFLWTPAEIEAALSPEDARLVMAYFDVTSEGNFEGRNILHVLRDEDVVAHLAGVSLEQVRGVIARARQALFKAREHRVKPARDDKILTSWNGLMLSAFAEAGRVLERGDYLEVAGRNARFLLSTMRVDRRLLRTYTDGRAKLLGYLEDYSHLVDGLLRLYEATFDLAWFAEARTLADEMLSLFWDEEEGLFYDTGRDHESLIVRPRDITDGATPSGQSAAVDVLLRLAILSGEPVYHRTATRALSGAVAAMEQYAGAFGHLLGALDFSLDSPREIALIGRLHDPAMENLLRVVFARYLPNKVVAGAEPDDERAAELIPLLADRPAVDGRPTAYVCTNYTCQQPVTTPEELAGQLS